METLRDNIVQMVGPHARNLDIVLAAFDCIKLRRNEWLHQQGNSFRHVYFVASGALQVVSTQHSGNEKTIDIVLAGNWFTDLESFQKRSPSLLSVRAVKSTEVYCIGQHSFAQLMETVPDFFRAYTMVIEQKYKESVQRLTAFSTLSTPEKIEWARTYQPAMLDLPDRLIASWLGISKETYCRLKQKR